LTVIFYENVESEQNHSGQGATWIDVASKSGLLNARPHWLYFNSEYGGNATNREVEIRVTINDVERGYDYHTPEISGWFKSFTAVGFIEPPTDATSYTIKLQVRAHTAQTINVRRIRLMVMQE